MPFDMLPELRDEALLRAVIVRARSYVANPNTWVQGAWATNRDGEPVRDVTGPGAVRFCAEGAKNMDELVRRVPGAMEVISNLNGFKAYYVVKAGDDTLATVSVFTDKAAAVMSNQAAAKWVKENAADLFSGTVDAVTGEIIAYRTSP